MGTNGAALLGLLEENTHAFWEDFGRQPGGTVGEEGGARWFRSGVPRITYNGVAGFGDNIDRTLARVRAWGLPARWSFSDASAPAGFEDQLAARGLELHDEWPGMVARIADLPVPRLEGATLEIVREDRQRTAFFDVFCDAFRLPDSAALEVRAAHEWLSINDPRRVLLLVTRDGEAVATGLLRGSPGVAGIYGIAVKRAFQKQGLGALATLLTVREGARRGAHVAILQATKEGLPVYQRLGFEAISTFRSWRIA